MPLTPGRYGHESRLDRDRLTPPEIRPKSLPKLFAQGKHWRRSDGTWVRVKDMHPAHRANAAAMLLRDAADWAQKVATAELGLLFGAPEDLFVAAYEQDKVRTADPEAWMRSTKLYRRLVKGLPMDSEALARLTALPDFTLTIPVGGPPAVTYPSDAKAAAEDARAADPYEEAAQARAFRMVLTVFEERKQRGGEYWSRALLHGDIGDMVAEAARRIGVTL